MMIRGCILSLLLLLQVEQAVAFSPAASPGIIKKQLGFQSRAARNEAAVPTSGIFDQTTAGANDNDAASASEVTVREVVYHKELEDVKAKIRAVETCLKTKVDSSISNHAAAVATTHQGQVDSYSEYVQMYREVFNKVELKGLLISLQEEAAALMTLTMSIKLDLCTIQLKHGNKSSGKESLPKKDITLDHLRLLVKECFPDPFLLEAFTICTKDVKGVLQPVKAKALARLLASSKPGDNNILTLHIRSDSKGFSEFTLKEALKYASGSSASKQESEDSSLFPPADFDESDPLIAEILRHAVSDIACKIPIYGPIDVAQNEASVRELIGPVLVASVRIAGHITKELIKIINEKMIRGSRGNGPVDYDMVYRGFNIVITEAKKDDVTKGIAQNIAQLVAGREDYLFERIDLENKEDIEFAALESDISDVPSYGVISTAQYWIFTRYLKGKVTRSSGFTIPLQPDTQEAVLRRDVLLVVRILVEILINQTKNVDKNEYTRSNGPADLY